LTVDWDAALNGPIRDAFGSEVTYTPQNSSPVAMTGIRKDPSMLELESPGNLVVLWFEASDFAAAPANGDAVAIGGESYDVVDVKKDAAGGLKLFLRRR
jgi:hypothetical protein